MFGLGPAEMVIIGVLAVLLFGSRLPSVMRNLGRGFVEFKKGVHGIEDEIHSATTNASTSRSSSRARSDDADDREEATAPKFEPPTSEGADTTAK